MKPDRTRPSTFALCPDCGRPVILADAGEADILRLEARPCFAAGNAADPRSGTALLIHDCQRDQEPPPARPRQKQIF